MLFGGHVSGGVKAAPERAKEIGANALQLFVQSPRAWRFPNHDPDVLAGFPERLPDSPLGRRIANSAALVLNGMLAVAVLPAAYVLGRRVFDLEEGPALAAAAAAATNDDDGKPSHVTTLLPDRMGRTLFATSNPGKLFRLSPTRFRLCCQERQFGWLHDVAWGFEARIEDESEAVAGLSLVAALSSRRVAASSPSVAAPVNPRRP